jgi:hypothetical protein
MRIAAARGQCGGAGLAAGLRKYLLRELAQKVFTRCPNELETGLTLAHLGGSERCAFLVGPQSLYLKKTRISFLAWVGTLDSETYRLSLLVKRDKEAVLRSH